MQFHLWPLDSANDHMLWIRYHEANSWRQIKSKVLFSYCYVIQFYENRTIIYTPLKTELIDLFCISEPLMVETMKDKQDQTNTLLLWEPYS